MSAGDWPVEVDQTFGCWRWQGRRDKRDGRALIWRGRTPIVAYREVYAREREPIGAGLVLDHLCRRPDCVNPDHLEPVTASENELRKLWRYRARRIKCRLGHELALDGMVTPEGGRVCRKCSKS